MVLMNVAASLTGTVPHGRRSAEDLSCARKGMTPVLATTSRTPLTRSGLRSRLAVAQEGKISALAGALRPHSSNVEVDVCAVARRQAQVAAEAEVQVRASVGEHHTTELEPEAHHRKSLE